MKKTAMIIMVITVMLAMTVSFAQSTDITVNVNGQVVDFVDQKPMIDAQTSRTIVPIRFIAQELGATVAWDNDTRTAKIKFNELEIHMPIDNKDVMVNGICKTLDQEAIILGSRTYVPVRFISEELGATVTWDNDTKTVIISTDSMIDEPVASISPAPVVDSEIYFMDNGRELKTTDLPRDAYQFPYILKEIPNSVYNDILVDDVDEKYHDEFPINFQETASTKHIEKNLQEWVDQSYAYNMHKMNVDYRTISDKWAYELVEITGNERDLEEALKYVNHVIENQVIISGTCKVEPSMTYYSTGVNIVSKNTFTLENFKTNDWVIFDGGAIYPI